MKLEKIKRKIADGYTDEEICNMSGMPVEEVTKVRKPPVVKKPVIKKPVIKKPVIKKKED